MDIVEIQPRDKDGKFIPSKYVAVVGLDYVSCKTGQPIRVEEGEEVVDLAQNAIDAELLAGNIAVAPEDGRRGKPVALVDVEHEPDGEEK